VAAATGEEEEAARVTAAAATAGDDVDAAAAVAGAAASMADACDLNFISSAALLRSWSSAAAAAAAAAASDAANAARARMAHELHTCNTLRAHPRSRTRRIICTAACVIRLGMPSVLELCGASREPNGSGDASRAAGAGGVAGRLGLRSCTGLGSTSSQGLALVHFSAQHKRFQWDRGCDWGVFRG